MQELEVTWQRVLPIWWLVIWRGLLCWWVFVIALAFVFGYAGAALGLDISTTSLIVTVLSLLAGLGWSLIVARMALEKSYQEFRLALVKKS